MDCDTLPAYRCICDFDGNFGQLGVDKSVQFVKKLVNIVKKGLDNLVNV